jgi:hypothetical protein
VFYGVLVGKYLGDQFFRPFLSQPPAIFGVCFANINTEKLNIILILLINFLETNGPFYVWRSGKAAKHQCHGLLPAEIRKGD